MLVYLIENILEERVGILSNERDSMFVELNTKERESVVMFQEYVIFRSAHLPRIPGARVQLGGGAGAGVLEWPSTRKERNHS